MGGGGEGCVGGGRAEISIQIIHSSSISGVGVTLN